MSQTYWCGQGTSGKRYQNYYTTGWQCVEERVEDLSLTPPITPVLDRQYVWGLRYIDDLVQRQRDTTGNGVLDETLYALTDRNFSVVALSDTSGNIVDRIVYEPYGQSTFLTSSYGSSSNTRDWRHQFQGLRRDYGLYNNRMRLLDPLTGRFLSQDPLGYMDGMNLYTAYHVMWAGMDPSGMLLYECQCSCADVLSGAPGKSWKTLISAADLPTANTRCFDYCENFSGLSTICAGKITQQPLPMSGSEPEWGGGDWDDGGVIQNSNNCYDYACNDPKDNRPYTGTDPGEPSGKRFGIISCKSIKDALIRDGAQPIDCDKPCKEGMYKIALAVSFGKDYHFYRQDSDGTWSHKRGDLEPEYRDACGDYIFDPRTANADYRGDPRTGLFYKICDEPCLCVKS